MTESPRRRWFQINLSTLIILSLVGASLAAEMCVERQIGARPIRHEGQICYFGTPFQTYSGVANADLTIKRKVEVERFFLHVALNTLFWLVATCAPYFLLLFISQKLSSRTHESKVPRE